MPKHLIDVSGGRPLLDIASYRRRGPGRRDRLSPADIALISRTVARTPEVMVKVLTHGGQSFGAMRGHLEYVSRGGDLAIETDDGQQLAGKGVEKALLEEWNLDLEEYRRRDALGPRRDRRPPKLAHKFVFSMPAGTLPQKVLAAVQAFAREEFGLKHRYAMVLHTDEPHPHVHMVVKAVSEQGIRLNIRRETLRQWRLGFARQLQAVGVAANATERAVRGENRQNYKDGIYRAAMRGESRFVRERVEDVARELQAGGLRAEEGRERLVRTRRDIEGGWIALSQVLAREDSPELAKQVRQFVERMPPPETEKERVAAMMLRHAQEPRPSEPLPVR